MANVQVRASGNIEVGNRCIVRTSGNRVYVLVTDSTCLQIMKGNQNGEPTSFIQQSTSCAANAQDIGVAACIDANDLIHIIRYRIDTSGGHGALKQVLYYTFDTTSDTFGIVEEVTSAILDGNNDIITNGVLALAICIDANDIPHIVFVDRTTIMGSTISSVFYQNRIGGTWTSPRISVDSNPDQTSSWQTLDIMIHQPTNSIGADRPIVTAFEHLEPAVSDQINAYHGNLLDATSFTNALDITTSAPSETAFKISLTVDNNNDIFVSFVQQAGGNLRIVKHLATQSTWSTWEADTLVVDRVNNFLSNSMAIDLGNLYIYTVEDVTNDVRLYKDVGAGFVEETGDPDLPNVGTFNDVKVKWASKNNNSPRELDYVFEDSGGAVQYNTFQGEAPPVSPAGQAESGTIGNMIFGIIFCFVALAHFIKG